MTASSASSHRLHKPTSIVRKLSKRARDRSQQPQPPPSAYIQQLARSASKRDKKHIRNFSNMEDDRPMSRSSFPARESINSSLSSHSSMRAYKIRSFELFTPRPRLRYENNLGSSPPKSGHPATLTPSRSNSRSVQRSAIAEEVLLRGGRVDDLADELDVQGLTEAMDRDRRRRERKKQEDFEKLHRKLERRAAKQRAQEQMDHDMGFEMESDYYQQMGESSRTAAARGGFITPEAYPFPDPDDRSRSAIENRSPVSWFNDPSLENFNKADRSARRVDMVTPVSMDSNQDIPGETDPHGPHNPRKNDIPESTVNPPNPSGLTNAHETQYTKDYPTNHQGGFEFVNDGQGDEMDTEDDSGRGKKSAWTSFIKKATAARIRREHSTREIQARESASVPGPEGDDVRRGDGPPEDELYKAEDIRHQGQTPGTHIPDEVAFAMTALETGHVRGRNDDMEAERRDSFSPSRPLAPYALHGRPSSSKSSLGTGLPHRAPTSNPRSYLGSSHSPEMMIDSPTLPSHPIRTSSQHSHSHYGRPSPTQRYSPSMHRHSLEAFGPDGRPRSLMSTSLASIDSEGSWLSGKVANPRGSISHISPLRTSATSLRRRYQEFDDNGSTNGDDYFSGVAPRRKRRDQVGDVELGGAGVARADLSDVEDSDEEASIDSEEEKKMWRDGAGRKPVVHEATATVGSPPKEVILKSNRASTAAATTATNKEDAEKDGQTTTRGSWSPAEEGDGYLTPLEQPYEPTTNSMEFETPMEDPSARQSTHAEIHGR